MSKKTYWEDAVALNSMADMVTDSIPCPSEHRTGDTSMKPESFLSDDELERCLGRDPYPMPTARDREGYYGERHFEYWLSGLRDYKILKSILTDHDVRLGAFLDMGCASGRLVRHFLCNEPDAEIWGCDINAKHVHWCRQFLPRTLKVFQNSSIPHLPIPDASLSLVSAYSVFTHIEAFDTAWLAELRRVLKPGGIAFLTAQTDHSLMKMTPDWPVYKAITRHEDFEERYLGNAMSTERLTFRTSSERSYSSNVFLHSDYIHDMWGRFLDVVEIKREYPGRQDAIVLVRP